MPLFPWRSASEFHSWESYFSFRRLDSAASYMLLKVIFQVGKKKIYACAFMWQRPILALHGENESFKCYFVSEEKSHQINVGCEIMLGVFLRATLSKHVGWRKSSLHVVLANENIVLASGLCGPSYTRTFLMARLAGCHDGLWSHFDCLWILVLLLLGDHPSIYIAFALCPC